MIYITLLGNYAPLHPRQEAMSQPLVLRFKESPFSPWGASNRAVSRGTGGNSLQNATQKLSASVGCITSVNSLIGEKGLQRRGFLPSLITDSSGSHLHRADPYIQRSKETLLEEMDHRRKTAIVKKKARNMTSSAGKTDQQSSAGKQQQKPSTSVANTSPVKEESSADTRLIELATYPGYDPHFPTPLPHGIVALEQMKRVTRAQKRLVTKREGFRETWRHIFYSPASQSIFQDYFWWFFLHRYQPQQFPHIQDLLFSRISINYVKILCNEIDLQWKDPFFKMYPDAIAQCVYTAFMHAYPTSWNSFDENFKNELCQYISLWQVGTKPIPNSWERWELSLLEPSNLLKHVGKDEESPSKGTKSGFNFDALLAKEGRKATVKGTAVQPKSSLPESRPVDKKSLNSSSKSLAKEDKKRLSFADIERALSSVPQQQSRMMTRDVDPKTQGVSTPPAKLTTLERKKIEVAKEQLNNLQKIVTEKRKARAPKITVNGAPPSQKKETAPPTVNKTNRQAATSLKQAAIDGVQSTRKVGASTTVQISQRHRPNIPIRGLTGGANTKSVASVASSVTNMSSCSSPLKKPQPQPAMKPAAITDKKQEGSSTTWKQRALQLKQRREEEQSTPLQGPVFEHAMFNVNGQSPLVKYYMKEKDLAREKEYKTLVNRTEISEKPPSQAVCYKDVLTESKEAGTKNQEQFDQHYKQQKQSMAESQRGRKKAVYQHKQNVKMVLANKKEVRELSTVLTEYTLLKKKGGDFNKTALTTAVNTTLNRVTKKS